MLKKKIMQGKRIVFIGNSGFARECYIMLRHVMAEDPCISFKGFLSFEGYEADLKELSSYFMGSDDDYAFAADEYAVIAIGKPELRKRAFAKLTTRNVRLYTLIHPRSYVDPSTRIGVGNVIGYNTYVSCNCTIGDANVLNGLIHVGHDCTVGDFNFVAPGVQILGCVNMGSHNSIGATSVILPHAKIGNGNIVAPLSAIYKGCRSNCYMAGSPAVKIGSSA